MLMFVPVVNFILPFVFLFKGRKWAWESKAWKSPSHFIKTQRAWSIAGIVFFLIFGVAQVAFLTNQATLNFQKYSSKAKQSEAKVSEDKS